ncbi:MAG: gamma-glutamylcyclotransferase [Methylococcaceae bacterium]|nr:gamma-glutamylcyclotransferase [Methylococcaceae bacterium]MDD1608683.1 gamma-glutamylcyclotransferase [Methylococcaceae bacterium]MDD1609838.1 gamma-glutamylcyclotransferase [Methylococcaceae bacterium]MDD1615959.1 gamma-glutamylcyclotransferase [Methylococcaceae bacterium]OYV18964.1 MAG: hypothetical protein CG439_1075 [Methylococcaceae bacterium NSP1-2]
MTIEFIFVYGTLRKEIAANMNDILSCYSNYFSDGYLQGKLYEVNGYPAVIESNNPQDKVYGEIYKILNSRLLLPELDAYEECTQLFPHPHEYSRKKLAITLFDGHHISAWVYIFNRNVENLIAIKSGDYLHHLNAQENL